MFIVAEVAALSVRLPAYCRAAQIDCFSLERLRQRTEWLLVYGWAAGSDGGVLRKFVKGLKKWRNP